MAQEKCTGCGGTGKYWDAYSLSEVRCSFCAGIGVIFSYLDLTNLKLMPTTQTKIQSPIVKVLDLGEVSVVDKMGDDQRIVDSARVSISGRNVKPTSTNERLIKYLLKNEHMTPFESVRFTFFVKCPIFIARQWVRHRASSFNEISARYSEMADEFYVPTSERMLFGGQNKDNKQGSGISLSDEVASFATEKIEQCSKQAYSTYQELLKVGVARELARMVLPVNLYTQFYWTVDLRNLLHFLDLRLHEHAQWEIRQFAEAIIPFIEEVCPLAVKAWKEIGSSK